MNLLQYKWLIYHSSKTEYNFPWHSRYLLLMFREKGNIVLLCLGMLKGAVILGKYYTEHIPDGG